MAKPLPQVSTLADALDYAQSAVKDAFKVCPKTAVEYQNVVTMAGQGSSVAQLVSALWAANSNCHYEKYGHYLNANGTCSHNHGKSTTQVIDAPGTGTSGDISKAAGFPLWLVLLLGGGALAYYLMSKDKKTGQTGAKRVVVRTKRAVKKVRRKVRKTVKKVRRAVARRRKRR